MADEQDMTNDELRTAEEKIAAESARRQGMTADALQAALDTADIETLMAKLTEEGDNAPTNRMRHKVQQAMLQIRQGFRVIDAVIREGRGQPPQ